MRNGEIRLIHRSQKAQANVTGISKSDLQPLTINPVYSGTLTSNNIRYRNVETSISLFGNQWSNPKVGANRMGDGEGIV